MNSLLARIWIYGRILWQRVVVVGYPGVTDPGNGGLWEWQPLGIADRNHDYYYKNNDEDRDVGYWRRFLLQPTVAVS